ncbi:SCO family protein [Alteribacillus sp. HJP-4]|uniref:SCO family protein n=1 Tax=Alteribacillus sp. HJP-4 TaxID=2775394 RepID=UPI0035CCD973
MNQKLFLYCMSVFALMALSGCAWLYEAGGQPEAQNGTDMSEADLQISDFSFTNQDGKTVSNEDLEGDYWLANMVFTSCPTVCTLMTPNMLNIQGKLEKENAVIPFVSFTVDPEFDDPDQLKKYGEDYGADMENWHFLTGYSDEDIKELSAESFKSVVEKDPENNDITHATSFFLIDEDGSVVRRYDGLDNDIDPVVEDIKALKEG